MISEEQRIERLLELQDHPELLTEEQLRQIFADDEMRLLLQQLGFAKRAFKYQDAKNETLDVDKEWEKFAATQAEELDALEKEEPESGFTLRVSSRKIAASFIGVLITSCIAIAAIRMVQDFNAPQLEKATAEQTAEIITSVSLPADTVKAKTNPIEPTIFNNVPFDSMLNVITAAHQVGVRFENDEVRQLRFHFVWKREDSLTRVVEKLNTFESVNIGIEDNNLVVR